MKLRPYIWLTLLLAVVAGRVAAQPVHNIWEPPYKQGIASQVEDKIITFEDLRREMGPLIPRIREESRSPNDFQAKITELYREVLQNLVDRVLIVKEFARKEYRLPPSVLENEMDRVLIEDFGNDRNKFLNHLRSQGLNVREFRKDLEERIIVSIMRGQLKKSQSEISPERIEKFYMENKIHFYEEESVHLRLIMLKPIADETPDLLRQNGEKVMAELKAGAKFEDLAKKYSQDNRKDKGGDWGWIRRADLREELSEVGFLLQPGTYSQPIKVGEQIFILYSEAKRSEGIQPLVEVRDRIENILSNQLAKQTQSAWLERLRKDAFVKYY
ncbi:MAG: peptidylprolyl isomerase [Verrucomicrobiota bacterium]|nr:peptidylprolyl isomerase [Verrucomicrobiota bacterium]